MPQPDTEFQGYCRDRGIPVLRAFPRSVVKSSWDDVIGGFRVESGPEAHRCLTYILEGAGYDSKAAASDALFGQLDGLIHDGVSVAERTPVRVVGRGGVWSYSGRIVVVPSDLIDEVADAA